MIFTGLGLALLLARYATEKDLSAATKLWQEMDMPVLSKDSRPVVLSLDEEPPVTQIAFTNPRGSKDRTILVGGESYEPLGDGQALGYRRIHTHAFETASKADWSNLEVKRVSDYRFPSGGDFDADTPLCGAIVAEIAGHHDLAMGLIGRVDLNHEIRTWYEPYFGSPVASTLLSYTALQIEILLAHRLLAPKSDRRAILSQLQKLVSKRLIRFHPHFNGWPDLMPDLRETVQMRIPKSGTPEAAVTELTNSTDIIMTPSMDSQVQQPDPRYEQVLRLGLAAVPALIGHLDDPRLTRSLFDGGNNAGPSIIEIGWVAEMLLRDISKGEAAGPDGHVTKALAFKWYRAKKSVGKG